MSNFESTKSASFAIANVFHADHGVERSTMQMLVEAIKPSGFFLHTQELPVDHADLVSALRGPLEGDAPVGESEVFYASRGGEGRGLSRMIALPKRRTRMVTIIGMATPAEDGTTSVVVYTCYGGCAAAQEPTDPSIANDPERLAVAKAFWRKHALASLDSVE